VIAPRVLTFHCPTVLLYPRDDQDVDVTYEVERTKVGVMSVDLTLPELAGVGHMADRVASMLGVAVSPPRPTGQATEASPRLAGPFSPTKANGRPRDRSARRYLSRSLPPG
jgi:hypothetical protein